MSVLAAKANGNLTASATWALIDATSYLNSEVGTTNLTTSLVASSAFTPGAITIDGVGIKCGQTTGAVGTVTVDLFDNTASAQVAGTSTTVNLSDIPVCTTAGADGGWFFFKFAGNVTLIAGHSYSIRASASIANILAAYRDATAANWSRYLRTTTAQAPAAGDDMIIAGEWTAAATMTARNVTMNETANTAYGNGSIGTANLPTPGLAIVKGGTLTWPNTGGIHALLRMHAHVIIYNGGSYLQGAVGAEIARNSTAWLEFSCAADSDYLFVNRNGTRRIRGLSRTIGKNIVNTLLTANIANANLISSNPTMAVAAGANAASFTRAPPDDSILATQFTDTIANAAHDTSFPALASVTGVTQTFGIYLAQGTGTHNRFVRVIVGNAGGASPTNGFYADVDLQAGTIGACTALGNGTATSAAISALIDGYYLVTLVGKVSSAAATPFLTLAACSASGTTSYAGDATSCFFFFGACAYTGSSIPTTNVLTVADDTGWLAGDNVAIASTSQAPKECEGDQLSINATATQLTMVTNSLYAHSGTSPTQAEVILLTRNCGVRSVSYSAVAGLSQVGTLAAMVDDFSWAEFYWLGINGAGGVGVISVTATLGSTNFDHCSMHDTKVAGIRCTNAALNNVTLSFVTMFNINISGSSTSGIEVQATTGTVLSVTDCIILAVNTVTAAFSISDLGVTIQRCVAAGVVTNNGFAIGESSTLQTGVISDLNAHANASRGVRFDGVAATVAANLKTWRNGVEGIINNSFAVSLVINGLETFGNLNQGMSAFGGYIEINNGVFSGDTSFASATGLLVTAGGGVGEIRLNNCTFGVVSGIKTAHTGFGDIWTRTPCFTRMFLNNCTLSSPTTVFQQTGMVTGSFVAAERLNGTAGNHKMWKAAGTISLDAAVYNVASPSEQLAPLSASAKLESGGKVIAVANGAALTVSAKVRKSVENNLIPWSQNIGLPAASYPGSLWTQQAGTALINAATAPDGTLTAAQYTDDNTSSSVHGPDATGLSLAAATQYTVSGYFKYVARQWVHIAVTDGVNVNVDAFFDILNGVVGTTVATVGTIQSISITPAGNGFFRCSMTFTTVGATAAGQARFAGAASNGTSIYTGNTTAQFTLWGTILQTGAVLATYSAAWVTTAAALLPYAGSQPRLVQKANPALGFNADVVLATASGAAGAWETLSGTTAAATDDGALEIMVDCDGTAGFVNNDDWAVAA